MQYNWYNGTDLFSIFFFRFTDFVFVNLKKKKLGQLIIIRVFLSFFSVQIHFSFFYVHLKNETIPLFHFALHPKK